MALPFDSQWIQCVLDFLGRDEATGVGAVRQYDRELIAPKPRHDIGLSHDGPQHFRDAPQDRVARRMASAIIYGFKFVEIDREYSGWLFQMDCARKCLAQSTLKFESIRKIRHRVVARTMLQIVGSIDITRRVSQYDHGPGHDSRGIEHRRNDI